MMNKVNQTIIHIDDTNTKALENKINDLQLENDRLIQVNKDLSSFNYIASHDLREPLRKIQMFSSLVSSLEKERLSEKGQIYLSRIIYGAERMEHLIDSLLAFSKATNISHIQPYATNLNVVLANVLNLYAEKIVTKNATIQSDNLPTIQGLEGQIEQIFTNLIDNSLKYAKANVPPHIKITAELVERLGLNNEPKSLWKIDFQDNSIGFDPIYEEKIFEVFLRLHTRVDYEGTGVGLAICKKIMLSHGGDIIAQGVVGEGTLFTLYFPA